MSCPDEPRCEPIIGDVAETRGLRPQVKPMTHGNEHLQGKMNGLKGKLPVSRTTASTRVFSYFSVSFILLCFVWVLVFLLNFILFWRILQKHKVDVRGKRDE